MSASYDIIPAARIRPHHSNVRRDLGDLAELAASIKGMGVLQPLTVAPDGDDYVVIAGHRRLAAAKEAGLEAVPCIVRDDLDSQAKVIEAMLVENLQRSDLTAMEEGDAYAQLELLGVKDAAICKATGRAPKTVKERRLLASLPTQRREQFENGRLSLEGAVKCARLREKWAEDAEILALIDAASTWKFGNDSWGSVEHEIKRTLADRNPTPEPEIEEVEDEDDEEIAFPLTDQERERTERRAKIAAATERLDAWWPTVMRGHPEDFRDGILAWAVDEQVDTEDPILRHFGISPVGEDEDYDDAARRIREALAALDTDQRITFVLLTLLPLDGYSPWMLTSVIEKASHYLGFELTDNERDLIEGNVR